MLTLESVKDQLYLLFFQPYISPIFHIFKKRIKNLKIPIFILSFVNDGLFILQDKSLIVSNTKIFCSYNVI